jgi:hypothetical protein
LHPGQQPGRSKKIAFVSAGEFEFVDKVLSSIVGLKASVSTMPEKPQPGQLQYEVQRFANKLINQAISTDPNPIDTYMEMLTVNPIAGAGYIVKVLLVLQQLGEYRHPDEKLQDFIRKNFERMTGSFKLSVAELLIAMAIGYSFSEITVRDDGQNWVLESILGVDPRRFRFEGKVGKIENCVYYAPGLADSIKIPYDKGIHIVNSPYLALGRDPYGVGDCRRCVAAWQAWKILIAELVITGQRMATPIIAMKVHTDQTITLLDQYGNPMIDPASGLEIQIPAADRALEELERLENRSVLVTDLENQIQVLDQQGANPGVFFFEALRYLERIMMLGQLIPETALSTGGRSGVGDSGLNEGHLAMLMMGAGQSADQVKESLLERVCRPLIEWNFGIQDIYGEFVSDEEDSADRVALIEAIGSIINTGAFSKQDLAVINRLQQLAGIPQSETLFKPPAPEPDPEPAQEANNGKNGKVPVAA